MLTSVERVAGYIGIQSVAAGSPLFVKLERLIMAASDFVEGYLSRTIQAAEVTLTIKPPYGGNDLMVPERLARLDSIGFGRGGGDQAVSDFQVIDFNASTLIRSHKGWPSREFVTVKGLAGYKHERHALVPSLLPLPTYLLALLTVTINGVFAVVVTGAPIVGQVKIEGNGLRFNSADLGKACVVQYVHTPPAIEQAVIDLVAHAHEGSSRIGVVSKSLGGVETVSYSQSALSSQAKMMLAGYRGTFA